MALDCLIFPISDHHKTRRHIAVRLRAIGWHLFAIACLFQLSIGQCAAANQSDWDSCTSQDRSKNIAACTRIIEDTGTSDSDRFDAYLWRGGDYVAQNVLDAAVSDYSNAIKLNPRNITAFGGRAIASFRKGDRDQAIIDYSLARRLDPGQLDTMTATSDDLKEIAALAARSPAPQSQLDAVYNTLMPRAPTCGPGTMLQGSTCVPITCPTGQRLSGSGCEPIVCGSGETLVGNDCTPNTKYLALAIGQTNHLAYGSSWNQETLDIATNDALSRCRNQLPNGKCKIVLSGADACIGIYWTPTGTGWGAAKRDTRDEAKEAALANCKDANPRRKCVFAGSWCVVK